MSGLLARREAGVLLHSTSLPGGVLDACADQIAFRRAWRSLRQEAADHDVRLYGDLPMFPVADSVDVWANRELFKPHRASR